MRSGNEQQSQIETTDYRELQVLKELEVTPDVTQRQLSKRLGIALGLTNVVLRNLTQKGYIRGTQTNWKRWLYTLTPNGFSHKLRLTLSYVQRVLAHYRSVRQTLREEMDPLVLNAESRVAIYGATEFAELVYLGLKEIGIEEIDIYGPSANLPAKFLGMPVRDVALLKDGDYQRVLVAYVGDWEQSITDLKEVGVEGDQVVAFFANGKTREDA